MIETLLQKSGLREVLGELKTKGETEAGTVNTTLEHYQLDVQALMADLTRELERIPMGSGGRGQVHARGGAPPGQRHRPLGG